MLFSVALMIIGDSNRCNTLRISDDQHIKDGFKNFFTKSVYKLFSTIFYHDDNYDDSHDIGRRVSALPDN